MIRVLAIVNALREQFYKDANEGSSSWGAIRFYSASRMVGMYSEPVVRTRGAFDAGNCNVGVCTFC